MQQLNRQSLSLLGWKILMWDEKTGANNKNHPEQEHGLTKPLISERAEFQGRWGTSGAETPV